MIVIIEFNFFTIQDYWIQVLLLNNFNGELLNVLLLNSINKYHPLLFYFSALSVIFFFKKNYTFSSFFVKYNHGEKKIFNNLILLFFTLGLGSWWALQEGSWGGWWNWDPSEVFGMIILINLLLILHSPVKIFRKVRFKVFLYSFIKLILISYLAIQLNFDAVSHNFGTRTDSFINIIILFKWELFLFTLLLVTVVKLKHNTFISLKENKLKINLFRSIISLIVLASIYYSFKQLWIDSIQELTSINITDNAFDIKWLVMGIFIISLYFLWNVSFYTLTLILVVSTNLSFYKILNVLPVFFLRIYLNFLHIFHFPLILLLYFNIENFFKSILIKDVLPIYQLKYINILNTDVFLSKNLVNSLNTLEESPQQLLNKSIDIQWFTKTVNLDKIEQVLTDGFLNLYYGVTVIDLAHVNLSLIFVLIFTLIFFLKNNFKMK
jgi:cytochrome c biogenesis factor